MPDELRLIEEKIKSNPHSVDADSIYKVANYYFINHNLDEALKYYNLLVKVNPNHKMGLFELGSIYSNIGNLNEAIKLWQRVISIDPHFTRAHFNLALAYSKLKRYSDALSELHITLSLVRQAGDPIGLEKRILQEIKRIQEIQSNVSATDSFQDIETQKQYAIILLKKGDLDSALSAFKEVIKINSNDVVSLLNIGIIYYKKKEYEEALNYLNRVIEIDPTESETYFYIANVYEEMGDYRKSVEYYKKAISLNPNNYFWYYKLGRILYTLGSFDESIKYYKKAVELNPLDSYSHNNLGIAYLDAGNITEAIKHFLKSIYLDPNDSYSYYNLSRSYVKLGQLSRAYKSIQKAIDLEKKPLYFLEAAKILYKLRNYKDSLVFAVKATEMDPNLFDAYILISKLYLVAKKYDEGISILEKFADVERLNLFLELAQMLYIKGDIDKSISTLKNILNYASDRNSDIILEVNRRLVKIYYSQGNYEQAYEYSKSLVKNGFIDKEDLNLLIHLYLKLKKYQELLYILSKINIDDMDNELLFYYSYCNIKIGLFEVARVYLEKLYKSYPSNVNICYYYFYSLLKTGYYDLAKEVFDSIKDKILEKDLGKNYDNIYANYIEFLYVFKDYSNVLEKGLNFINLEIDIEQKQKIVEFLFKSLYESGQILKIAEFSYLLDISNYEGKYFYLLSLIITRNYPKMLEYIDKYPYDFSHDNIWIPNYTFIYLLLLLILGKWDILNNFISKLNNIDYVKKDNNFNYLKILIYLYSNNIKEAIDYVIANYELMPDFYIILGIKYGFIEKDKVNRIFNNLPEYIKNLWKIYIFDYKNINNENLEDFIKLVDELGNYKDSYCYFSIYFLPVEIVDYYFYNPVLLFFHMITIDIENYLIDDDWDSINIFKNIDIKRRKMLFEKMESLIGKLNGGNYYINYLYAKFCIIMCNLDKAISLLFSSLNNNRFFYSAHLLLSSIYYIREMYELSIEQLLEIYNDDNEKVRYLLAKNYIATKSFKLADEEFSNLLSKKSENYKYLYYKVLVNVYMMNNNLINELEKIYFSIKDKKLSREFLEVSLYLAYIYILIKKYKESEEILLELLNYYPSSVDIYKYLSIIYFSTNQIPKVLNVCNMGIKNIGNSSELYSQRGVLYYKAGKIDLAERDFLKAYELNPLDFIAVSHLGLISLKKENLESALNYFKEAISIKPLAYDIYTNIGNVYEKMGKIIEAREYFEIAYEHNPANIQNIRKLIEVLKKLSDSLKLQMIKDEIEKNQALDIKTKQEILALIGG